MKKQFKKFVALSMVSVMTALSVAGCGGSSNKKDSTTANNEKTEETTTSTEETSTDTEDSATASSGEHYSADQSVESIVVDAAKKGKVGSWGGGSEYEVLALLAKYGQDTTFLSQAFDMDGFDDGSILLASAMTYNELGLVKNDYDGGYGYGDKVGIIDMNKEGVGMLEDNLFCTREFAEKNPNTVKAFISASMKGWQYACENPEEAADIVFKYGSSVSPEHQSFMAAEVKKLVETDMEGNEVHNYGEMVDSAMQQTVDICKEYLTLDDSSANENLKNMTLDDIRDASYWTDAMAGEWGELEKTDVSIQLKWLPQCQFMGYYVALDKGYYDEVGLNVTIVPGGGDIGETSAVYTGQVDFGTTWVATILSANAGGMDLLEVSQVYQSSGIVLIYKID